MHAYERLRAIRAFEREHLQVLETVDDFNLVLEIAYHEALGRPLNLKQLFLLGSAPASTVQRRLRRLKRLGVVEQLRSREDRRVLQIKLSAKFRKTYGDYDALLANATRPAARRRRSGAGTGRRRGQGAEAPEPMAYVYPKTLRRAAAILGGMPALAARLRVPPSRLDGWLRGTEVPPLELFLECVDVALTAIQAASGQKEAK